MNLATLGEMTATIAVVAAVVIIVWALWPASAVGLAAI